MLSLIALVVLVLTLVLLGVGQKWLARFCGVVFVVIAIIVAVQHVSSLH